MTQLRELGRSGLATPPLILGGNVFGWTADRAASFRVLDAFAGGGGTMIDTADSYSRWVAGNEGGESESIIGAWLAARGKRDDVLIATKVGAPMNDGTKGLAPARIIASVDASLKRLGTDYIDLYYAHYDDPETPFDAVLDTFDLLIRSGKVRAIGASNHDAVRFAEALDTSAERGIASYTVLQPEYNLLARSGFEDALQPLSVERGIGVAPYYGLASGFLTGKYRTESDIGSAARGGSVKRYLTPDGLRVLQALDSIANEQNATPAQVALAWLAAQPAVVAPIASATRVEQVNELLGVLNLTLAPEQLELLDAASRSVEAVAV